MKTTTKILIGIGIALPVLFIGACLYLASLPSVHGDSAICINTNDTQSVELSPAKYLTLSRADRVWSSSPYVYIRPLSDTVASPRLIIPTELKDYVKVDETADTLAIAFVNLDELARKKNTQRLNCMDITLYLDADMLQSVDIINEEVLPDSISDDIEVSDTRMNCNIMTYFRDWHSKTPLKLNGTREGHFYFTGECTLGKVHVVSTDYLSIYNSVIDTLTLELDNIRDWKVNNSTIDIEQLFGSTHRYLNQPPSTVRRIEWYPQPGNAMLELKLSYTPAIIEYQ